MVALMGIMIVNEFLFRKPQVRRLYISENDEVELSKSGHVTSPHSTG
jgi:hypothetical protein